MPKNKCNIDLALAQCIYGPKVGYLKVSDEFVGIKDILRETNYLYPQSIGESKDDGCFVLKNPFSYCLTDNTEEIKK